MRLKTETAATLDPLSLPELKAHLLVDVDTDDALISANLAAAVEWAEDYQGRAYMERTYTLYLDAFQNPIVLPRPPVSAVNSIKYLDTDEAEQTVATAVYELDNVDDNLPARVFLMPSQSWPAIGQRRNPVRIEFVAGYDDADDLPEDIKLGLKHLCAHYYENRETIVTGTIIAKIPYQLLSLFNNRRVAWPF